MLTTNTFAMTIPDTVFAKVGDKCQIEINFDELRGDCRFRGTIYLANPSMFYPEEFVIINGNFASYSFARMNDSIYSFDISFIIKDDPKIYLSGEALAGNDTISGIKFINLWINDDPANNSTTFLSTHFSSSNILYFTRDRILNVLPNPLINDEPLRINFEIGTTRNVKFLFYNQAGILIYKTVENRFSAGKNSVELNFNTELSSGAIYIIMQTDGFNDKKRFIYIK